jgi:hypothetical protein
VPVEDIFLPVDVKISNRIDFRRAMLRNGVENFHSQSPKRLCVFA